jgi:hypothetical protein
MWYGRRIEVATLNPDPPAKPKRKAFEPRWIKVPRHWISALGGSKSANTYRLALLILWEAFKNRRRKGEIVLSTRMTGMSRATKVRAATELADLGLIRLEENGALRASIIHYDYYKNKKE